MAGHVRNGQRRATERPIALTFPTLGGRGSEQLRHVGNVATRSANLQRIRGWRYDVTLDMNLQWSLMMKPKIAIAFALTLVFTLALALTSISHAAEEKWQSLFNGKNVEGWTTSNGKPMTKGWVAKDGVLHRESKGGDLFTAKAYSNFIFELEWKISPAGNSGIKYRMADYGGRLLGPECQVLDDDKHPDGKKGKNRQSGALYDILECNANKDLKPVGEWNHVRIVANGSKLEHWLNGKKVVDIDTASHEWKKLVAASKFKNVKDFGTAKSGRIMLQDHSDPVWYRNIRIQELD